MTTTWEPQIVDAVDEAVLAKKKIGNLPPKETRVRATLGKSSLVGTLGNDYTLGGGLVRLYVEPIAGNEDYEGFREMTLWLEIGWTFELLDDEDVSVPDDARELVGA
jgi:hypothetical protein